MGGVIGRTIVPSLEAPFSVTLLDNSTSAEASVFFLFRRRSGTRDVLDFLISLSVSMGSSGIPSPELGLLGRAGAWSVEEPAGAARGITVEARVSCGTEFCLPKKVSMPFT